jgi:Tat protein secretion system quality control protein TatD with DNase activity
MISIKDYIFNNTEYCDSHANLLGQAVYDKYPSINPNNSIVMCNVLLEDNVSFLPYFDKFVPENKQYIYSANGKDLDELKSVINKYEKHIRCIGEIKCYKHCIDHTNKELECEDFSIVTNLEFTKLPVFVHCDLSNERVVSMFEEVIKSNANKKVVLCHCGINDLDNKDFAFKNAIELQHKYNNLWFEISWKAYDYIGTDNRKMAQLDTDRIVLGTDLTKYISETDYKKTMELFRYWNNQIRNQANIRKLLSNDDNFIPKQFV